MGNQSLSNQRSQTHTQSPKLVAAGAAIALMGAAGVLISTPSASAIGTTVDLGTAASYSVLGGASVTNTGPSVLAASLGVSPGIAITGFPPGLAHGDKHVGDAHALQAQFDLTVAYDAAAGQAPDDTIAGDIGGSTLTPGVYKGSSSIGLTGPLTLDAQGDPDAVFVFQIGSTLTTATSSSVKLINGAQGCHVFWQVGSSATLGTDTTFVGNILALTSITADTGATVDGRALARNGSVILDNNTFSGGPCTTQPTSTPTGSPTSTSTTAPTQTPTTTSTSTATSSTVPTSTATSTTVPTGTATSTTVPTGTATSTVPTGTATSTVPTGTATTTAPTSTATRTAPTQTPTTPPTDSGLSLGVPGLPSTGAEGPVGGAHAVTGLS